MDKIQADSIVQAILEPDVRTQEGIRRKRAAEATQLAQARKIAWFTLAGCGIGAIASYFIGVHFAQGSFWGCITGAALGRLFISLRSRLLAA